MLADQRAKGPLVVLDGGDSLGPPLRKKIGEGDGLQQRRIKAELIADAMMEAGLDAMALGAADWALGASFVRKLAADHHLPVLAANLTCGGEAPFPGGKVVTAGSHRVGVVGVTLGDVEGCEVSDATAAVERAVAELGEVDVVVGLVPADSDRSAAVLWARPTPLDIVIDTRGRTVGSGANRREGSVWVSGGSRGKTVGLATLSFQAGAEGWVEVGEAERVEKNLGLDEARVKGLEKRIADKPDDPNLETLQRQLDAYRKRLEQEKAELEALRSQAGGNRLVLSEIQLDTKIADHASTAEKVAAAKAKVTELGGAFPAKFVPRVVTDAASPFAGGQACESCHTTEHAQWAATPHARAWNSLVAADRAMDDDCWSCHVTGANAPGGPSTAAGTGGFHDIQCEACHGPARAHVANPEAAGTVVRDPPAEICTSCHDGVRDEGRGFDPATFRPKVVHTAADGEGAAESAPKAP